MAARRAKEIIRQVAREGRINDHAYLGERLAADLRRAIVELSDPPNQPSTLEVKAGANPLLDTRRLVDSIDYRVSRTG